MDVCKSGNTIQVSFVRFADHTVKDQNAHPSFFDVCFVQGDTKQTSRNFLSQVQGLFLFDYYSKFAGLDQLSWLDDRITMRVSLLQNYLSNVIQIIFIQKSLCNSSITLSELLFCLLGFRYRSLVFLDRFSFLSGSFSEMVESQLQRGVYCLDTCESITGVRGVRFTVSGWWRSI